MQYVVTICGKDEYAYITIISNIFFRVDEDETIDDTVNAELEEEEEEGGKRAITYQVGDTLQYMIKF